MSRLAWRNALAKAGVEFTEETTEYGAGVRVRSRGKAQGARPVCLRANSWTMALVRFRVSVKDTTVRSSLSMPSNR
jgi:hypothetical protein